MAFIARFLLILSSATISLLFHPSLAARTFDRSPVTDPQTQLLHYHGGSLLRGRITVNLIWYGSFTAAQKAILSDFIPSISDKSSAAVQEPSVAGWWRLVEKYYRLADEKSHLEMVSLVLGNQILDQNCSLGKSLSQNQIIQLASISDRENAINVVLTAADVAVAGFCVNRCGTHGTYHKFTYIWVGNSETQCPGYCAWPFHQPTYGPQTPPLVAPNNYVGLDGMVINLASLLAGTATNPFGNGFYQGPATAPLEAATACPGIYGKGAYPGYAGELRVDPTTGGSYNANGGNGRKYLVPAIFDPSTSTCSTVV